MIKTELETNINLNDLYKILIDQSPLMITLFDADLKILYANDYTCNFIGIERDELRGKSLLDYMTEESIEPFLKLINSITIDNPIAKNENRNVDHQGNVHWNLWYNRGIFNKDDELIGYQSIGQDVTRKIEIESALAENRRRLSEAQQIGNMGGWEWIAETNQTYWSDETYRLLGLEPGEIEPSQDFYRKHIMPEDLTGFLAVRANGTENGSEEFSSEYRIINHQNKVRWLRDRGRISYENGKPTRISGTILDITESKELQISLEGYINLEATLLEISNMFMLSEKENSKTAIEKVLKILGLRLDADRSYIVLKDSDCSEYYEWCSNTYVRKKNRGTPPHSELLRFGEDEIIPDTEEGGRLKDCSWFELNNIGAFIAVRLYQNNRNCGYLCLDSSGKKPDWINTDLSFLKISGEMCANARESIRARAEIEHEKELLSVTLMSIGDGFVLLSSGGRLEMINNSAVELLGISGKKAKGRQLEEAAELIDIDLQQKITVAVLKSQAEKKKKHRECSYMHPNGSSRTLSYSCSIVPDTGSFGEKLALVFRDVTEERRKQNEIAFMSFHDSLTGLYNRAFMDAELRRLDTARQLPLSIITGDVNGLKLVNDVFGHKEGDKLIIKIGEILESCCRDEDVISRWGGDEFSIILPATDQQGADRICERIRRKCDLPSDISISPSIALGYATKTSVDEKINGILREAEDRMYRQKLLDDRSVRSDIITSLQNSMFEKSFETEEHTQRMLRIAKKFGKSLKLPMNLQSELELLALMHDMGKIAVPARILGKTEKLTDSDWEEIKKHPEAGYRIAKSSQKLTGIADLILAHHERWDGKGYPRGLKGNEIPELARIISIIDTFDVMTSGRIYKAGVSPEEAFNEISKCAGSQFDPVFAEKFIMMMRS